MINFYNITDRQNQEYYEAIEVYKAGTPDELQLKTEVIDEKMDSGNAVIIMAKQNVMPAFMALLWKLEGTDFIVNEIISVIPSFKDVPFGKMYFDVLKHSDYYQNNHILFEAEDPEFGDKIERTERINYLLTHGFQWVKNVKTIVPHPTGDSHENTLLMLLTQDRFIEFSLEDIKKLLIKLYKDLYHTEEDTYILKEILAHLPEEIEITGKYEV
ncbi:MULTISPECIES: hypothetical protein [unclassified Lentimicrobium]|uniref:hypothetical protein n=1 Tax=unclassified Lentimicrobium TaxID=2677434 RepID=UPI001551C6ED|nr:MULTISPECIES: hypothetical protein [unclassified Lentimicrobium]NPD46226.1 hypothetical protein [Lentimicrobium sp. S6]NPD86276.1 hypothetical protein [Lentimicrobium sp. L6]